MIGTQPAPGAHFGPSPDRARQITQLWRAVLLTGIVMVIEAAGGFVSGSLALLSDAGHMLTDLLALVLSLMGGLIGVLIGGGLSILVSKILGWPTLVSTLSVLISFAFAMAIGIFFGYYPAHKAAALDPIEALRYE